MTDDDDKYATCMDCGGAVEDSQFGWMKHDQFHEKINALVAALEVQ